MKPYLLLSIILFVAFFGQAQNYSLTSPDGHTTVVINVSEKITYSVAFNGQQVLNSSGISFEFKQAPPLGFSMATLNHEKYSSNTTWEPVLKRYKTISDHHNGLRLELKEKKAPGRLLILDFRIFDDGVAFRSEFPEQYVDREFIITNELSEFNFTNNHTCWAVNYGNYTTSQEVEFWERKLEDITPEMVIGLPMTVQVSTNCYAAITEAALVDYAGMYIKSNSQAGEYSVRTQLAPRKGQPENGDKVVYVSSHKTPWRVIMLGETPGDLVISEIVQNLNAPCEIEDPSWIKPGVSAWDHWWSGEVKMEQSVIKEYIDLASSMGWPYMLIDWQWYGQYNQEDANIMTVAPQLNMPEILEYAKSKNVKCWLWLYNTDVDRGDFKEACALYETWGIAGIKIDFMDSDDQEMVNWYHRIVKTAARYHLMVDFHGAYKPTGWRRTYPNLLTREGVMGNEYNKWSLRVTPEHMCTLPFTRMLAGPMDFTPGGFLNRNSDKFMNETPAKVLGTRSNTLSQFVIYDSPYLVACDHPDNYEGQVGVEFLKNVKSVWDDTKVLNGEIGKYITMARRSENMWFIGSMTNSMERELTIKLDFIDEKSYKMVAFSDSEKTVQNAEIVDKKETVVKKGDSITIKMVPGGGYAAYLKPME